MRKGDPNWHVTCFCRLKRCAETFTSSTSPGTFFLPWKNI